MYNSTKLSEKSKIRQCCSLGLKEFDPGTCTFELSKNNNGDS